MKDTVHPAVHRSVHLCGERKLLGALRLRMTRQLLLDTGRTPGWAGATPLRRLAATNVVGSLQPSQEVENALSDGVLPVSS